MAKTQERIDKPDLVSFHSFTGGTGKSTLSLMLASALYINDRENQQTNDGGVLVIDTNWQCPSNLVNYQYYDLQKILRTFDRSTRDTFIPKIKVPSLELRVITANESNGFSDVAQFRVGYLGFDAKTSNGFLDEWESRYLTERLFKLVEKIQKEGYFLGSCERKTMPKYFIIDNAPQMHSLSKCIFDRISDGEMQNRGRAVIVFTLRTEDVLQATNPKSEGNVSLLLNQAPEGYDLKSLSEKLGLISHLPFDEKIRQLSYSVSLSPTVLWTPEYGKTLLKCFGGE